MIKPFVDKHPVIHETAFIADDAIVIGDVEIGEDASVWFGSVVRGDVNYIRIGERTNIQDMSHRRQRALKPSSPPTLGPAHAL